LREIERTGESRGLLAVMTRSGEQRIWEYHNTLRTEGVETPIVRGIAHDVTERVRAEKALRASNEQLLKTAREREQVVRDLILFRALLDQSNDAIEVVDPETLRFLDVNQRACVELGYSREELLSMTVLDIDPNVDESRRMRVQQQWRDSGLAIMETVHRRKDGTTFPVEVNIRQVRLDREYSVAISRDITERKRTEEAIANLVQVRADSSENFFSSMACQLAKCLEADYALIGELIEGDESKVKTIGVCCQRAIAENFTYELAHTPCAEVMRQGVASYVSGVAEMFPKDLLLNSSG
jgi:PAS domain S-box-containing protein